MIRIKDKSKESFIGIDPGQKGAIAIISNTYGLLLLKDWPGSEIAAADLLRNIGLIYHTIDIERTQAAIEYVHSMPKQGVSSTFKFGTNFGIWKGILAAFAIPFIEVRPQQWKKNIIKKADGKLACINVAKRMFPSAKLEGPRGGLKDGRAEALLIADWCRRQYI